MSKLLKLLEPYTPQDEYETRMRLRLRAFLEAAGDQNPFARDLAGTAPEHGHVTGSAWVVNAARDQCVLLYHAKLGKWVQPGGHCDGESDVLAVARREAEEETGLAVQPVEAGIFDIDIHEIPEYWNTPAHLHFDVRFLLEADDSTAPVVSHESKDVRWVSLEEALELSGEESVRRMVRKTKRAAPPPS